MVLSAPSVSWFFSPQSRGSQLFLFVSCAGLCFSSIFIYRNALNGPKFCKSLDVVAAVFKYQCLVPI